MDGTDESLGAGKSVLGLLSGVLDHFRDNPIESSAWAGICLVALVLMVWLLRKALRTKPVATGDHPDIQGGWMPAHFGTGSPDVRVEAPPKPRGPNDGSGALSRIEQSVARARLDLERLSSDMRVLRSSHKSEQGKVAAKISSLKDELAALSASFVAFSAKLAKEVGDRANGPNGPRPGPELSAEIASIARDLHLE